MLKIPKAALRFQPKLSDAEREEFERYLRERRDGGSREGPAPVSEAQRGDGRDMPKVWILTPEGFLRPVAVRLGISDDQFTELIGDGLQAGQELVTGMMDKDGAWRGSISAVDHVRSTPIALLAGSEEVVDAAVHGH